MLLTNRLKDYTKDELYALAESFNISVDRLAGGNDDSTRTRNNRQK